MKHFLIALSISISTAFAATHQTEPHLPGYYEGDFVNAQGDKEDAKLWIRESTDTDGSTSTYGLLLRNNGKDGAQLFRVEDIGDGKQMWMQLFQTEGGLIQFGEDATYDGTLFWKRKRAHIRLAVTPNGGQYGCQETVELKSARGPSWVDFPSETLRVKGKNDSEAQIDSKRLEGRVVINGNAYTGSQLLQTIFPGASLMHGTSVSQDSIDGKSVHSEITAVVAPIFHAHWWPLRDKYHFHFIRLEPGKASCHASSSRFKQAVIQ